MSAIIPINGQTWLICGGRRFADQTIFDAAMADIMDLYGCPARIVHGNARGADQMAGDFGRRMSIEVVAVPADWSKLGAVAGPVRNALMLEDYKPAVVVAMPGGLGTADMVRRARDAQWKPEVIEVMHRV